MGYTKDWNTSVWFISQWKKEKSVWKQRHLFKSRNIPQNFWSKKTRDTTAFTENEAHTRAAFKIEELVEFVAATSPNKEQLHEAVMLHEALDKAEEKYLVKHSGKWSAGWTSRCTDRYPLLYLWFFSLLGIVPDRIFEIVHQANMGNYFRWKTSLWPCNK